MRLITWNVAGRVARQAEQAAALAQGSWDVVCLQEVTPTTLKPWRLALQAQGLREVRSSLDEWLPGEPTPEGRRLGVITAARGRLETMASAHVPWPERLLTVRVGEKEDGFVVHNLHSPISQKPGRVKVRTHRALHRHLARRAGVPSLLVGDLNTPRREFPDGRTWSFARTAKGGIRLDRGEDWDREELALLRGLEEHGLRDLYRDLHGYARDEISFAAGRGRSGWRLDHIIGSEAFVPVACEYEHGPRERGLSDHSPMWVEVTRADRP